jgi:hypothetical protein
MGFSAWLGLTLSVKSIYIITFEVKKKFLILSIFTIPLNILGTIAGDDTIFVTPQSHHSLEEIKSKITQLLEHD